MAAATRTRPDKAPLGASRYKAGIKLNISIRLRAEKPWDEIESDIHRVGLNFYFASIFLRRQPLHGNGVIDNIYLSDILKCAYYGLSER